MLFGGGSVQLADMVEGWNGNFYLQLALYLMVFGGIYYLLFVGLDFYGGFVLEHKFGLSNQKSGGWLKREAKKGLLSLLMLLISVETLYVFLRSFPNHWWLWATGAWFLLTVVIGRIAPVLIIPLFYKCRPITDTQLRERLLELGKSCDVKITEVFKIGLSKDTRKANAAVAGLGKSRRILLGDTLSEDYSADEIEAIFAHELGHIRLSHIAKIIVFGTGVSLVSFYLTFVLFRTGTNWLGFDRLYDIGAFPLLTLILMAVGLVLMPLQLAFMRALEKQADTFAVEHIANSESLASALEKLTDQNLVDTSPSKSEELLLYDHPPISKRLSYIRQNQNSGCNGK
jgi:STE24 endopeptidase